MVDALRLTGRGFPSGFLKMAYLVSYPYHLFSLVYFYFRGKALSPRRISIDPGNVCNLRCPLCPTGTHSLRAKQNFMTVDRFELVLSKLPQLNEIELLNWGEPLLNPQITTLIRMAKKKAKRVEIHTHFSLDLKHDFFVDLVETGLDQLWVSIDGATQETYSRYRVQGDLNLVLANIRSLVAAKMAGNHKFPNIVWKMIVNKYNEHEVEKAKEMALGLGVGFETNSINVNDYYPDLEHRVPVDTRKAEWLPKNPKYQHSFYRESAGKHKTRLCTSLFQNPVVDPNGFIAPCCYITDSSNYVGDLKNQSFGEIWNGEKYSAARELFFRKGRKKKLSAGVCSKCRLYKKENSLVGALMNYRREV